MEQELSNNDKADAEERDYKAEKAAKDVARDLERRVLDVGIERDQIEEALAEQKPIDETATPPPPAPEPTFTRYGFKNMPGVALIVPDQTPPAELIRIAASVVEEISLMVLRKTAAALLGG